MSMSAGQDPNVDIVAVACVVEASLLLASEWSRIMIEYVFPLLRRLDELHPSHQFRIAFVTYGSADTRPRPLVSTRFFAPLSQIRKELSEDPSKLGIGQTNSGSGRGLSALEGFVAAIELFDIFMTSVNFAVPQSPQKENRSLISHMLHIAASPPDSAQRPHYNILHYLDSVNWDTMPTELRKRKINLSLISLRKVPQFQDLQLSVAGSTAQSPWFNVHAPHVLLLAGFPPPQKTNIKRQPDALLSDQSPDTKRQKLITDATSKRSSASPALPPARIPATQNQRPQQPMPPQVAQLPPPPPPPPPPPLTAAGPNLPSVQPVQPTPSAPTPSPAVPQPSAGPLMNPEFLEQIVPGTGLKFVQVMERLKALEREILLLDAQISHPQNVGQTAVLAKLEKDRASKVSLKERITLRLKQHYHKTIPAKGASNPQAGSATSNVQNPMTDAGPPTQSHPPNPPYPPSEKPPGLTTEEQKPVLSGSQTVMNLWQSRGGTISASGGIPSAGPSQAQPHPTPGVAPQMQKSIAGPFSQESGTPSQETSINSTATSQPAQPLSPSTWNGMLSCALPKVNNGQGPSEVQLQIHVIGVYVPQTPSDIRTDNWPRTLILNTWKEPMKDSAEVQSWLKRHKPRCHIMQFKPSSHAPDGSTNEHKFQGLNKFMLERRIFAYAGWQLPSGKFSHNIVIFPVMAGFVGAVFPEGVPDLPGGGSIPDSQVSVAGVKPQLLSGLSLPPALMAQLQGLDSAKQKLILAQWFRTQHELRRQQLQQTQQVHDTSGEALNSHGMPIPSNAHNASTNIFPGLQLNADANGPMNAGSSNTVSGTVNSEMMRSFMKRNPEGSTSTSQGINPG